MASKTLATLPLHTIKNSVEECTAIKSRDNGLEGRQRETAQYISDMILELRNLAKSAKLHHVMAPLEFAYYESYSAANRVEPPAGEAERLQEMSKVAVELEKIQETEE